MRKSFVRLFFSLLLIIPVFYTNSVSGKCPFIEYSTVSDTAGENQLLYNGRIWRNLYRRIEGDQFLNTDEFIPGTVIIGEKKYQNINLKYDIFNDEILTSSNKELLITLNKEMVDSFTIMYFNKVHHFKRLKEDSSKVVDGYVDVLYRGDISLYVKYMKKIDPVCAFKVYDNFFQIHRLYVDNAGAISPVNSKKDIIKIFPNDSQRIKDFIRSNKIKVYKEIPESFITLIAFCNTLENR